MRVHLYERGFRQEPDSPVSVDGTRCGCDPGLRRRTPKCHERSAAPPDDRPRMPPSLHMTAAPTTTPAAQSAARLAAVKLLIAKNIATSPTDAITFLSRLVDPRTAHEQGGTTAPESVFPLLFFAFVGAGSLQGSWISRREPLRQAYRRLREWSTWARCRTLITPPCSSTLDAGRASPSRDLAVLEAPL